MKVLFFLRQPGYVRNFESTLRLLSERGHKIEVIFDRKKSGVAGESALIERLEGETEGRLAHMYWRRKPRGSKARTGELLRATHDYLRYLEPVYADAPRLRRRAELRVPQPARALARGLGAIGPLRSVTRRIVRFAVERLPAPADVRDFVSTHDPDLVVVSPLVDFGSWQSECLAAARQLGIPTCLCVASWDNLTNKGLIKGSPDAVAVWNETQAREATELHRIAPERVFVAGAWAYDHWFEWGPSTSREEFCGGIGLRADVPFVLYLCSSGFIARHEAPFIARLIAEMRSRAGLADLGVLVRPHPYNPPTYPDGAPLDLAADRDAVVWPKEGANPISIAAKQEYFDSIHHCALVIGVNTSALIESAILARRVLTVLDPQFRETQEGTLHFDYLRTAGGGFLRVADDLDELLEAISAQLGAADTSARADGFLRSFIRPHGRAVAATPLLVDFLERQAGLKSPAQRRTEPVAAS